VITGAPKQINGSVQDMVTRFFFAH